MSNVEAIKKAFAEFTTLNIDFTPDSSVSNAVISPTDGYRGTYFTVIGAGDQQNDVANLFTLAVNSVPELLTTLEALQRENEEQKAWIKTATLEITKAIGGGSEMFTQHGDDFRVDPAFVATYIQFRRERHADSKKASIKKERELLARVETAEAEVKRLQAEIDRKSSMPGDHRYWEGRYRDEAAENERLRGVVERAQSIISISTYPNWHATAIAALASAGEEHHADK